MQPSTSNSKLEQKSRNETDRPRWAMRPPSEEYSDDILFGARRDARKQIEKAKVDNNADCAMYSIGTCANKTQWYLQSLIKKDKRLNDMCRNLNITNAHSIQRYAWPQIHGSNFAVVCIAPESTGKTYASLLYVVTKCIQNVPIADTDHIISMVEDTDTFKMSDVAKQPQVVQIDDVEIDQANFNFDALGKPAGTSNPTSTSKKETTSNGWTASEQYEVDPDSFIDHPKYVIVCSTQSQVDLLYVEINKMKEAAFGAKAVASRRDSLPPVVRKIKDHHDVEKMASRCGESEVLLTTPGAFNRLLCIDQFDFAKCKKLIFDDLDIAMQLHNNHVREIIKYYLLHTTYSDEELEADALCHLIVFTRKWTGLVEQFVSEVFKEKTLIFGSLSEACVYAELRFELEVWKQDATKVPKLVNILKSTSKNEKVAIVCDSPCQMNFVQGVLHGNGFGSRSYSVEDKSGQNAKKDERRFEGKGNTIMITDAAIEFETTTINDVRHLIHLSIPEDFATFDRRFRLMYRHIDDKSKGLKTTLFMNSAYDMKLAKEIYDLGTRSNGTLSSSKLALRDFISENSSRLCWRWATSGVCRLEKLARDDKFGSFCLLRHSLPPKEGNGSTRYMDQSPKSGQVKMTITHCISPNEIYFWFESHRSIDTRRNEWKDLTISGCKFMNRVQTELDKLRDTPESSVALRNVRKGKIYAVYLPQETRVDRVMLLEEPLKLKAPSGDGLKGMQASLAKIRNQKLQYNQQYECMRVDYGVRISVFVKNLIELPDDLANIPPQARRGFLLGYKPIENEPDWSARAKRHFFDIISSNNIVSVTAWLRLARDNNYWLENLIVSKSVLTHNGRDVIPFEPLQDMCIAKLALPSDGEPSCLPKSICQLTISKWNLELLADSATFAFLPKDKAFVDVFVLHAISSDMTIKVRLYDYNKQLLNLEQSLNNKFRSKTLRQLHYFARGTYCLVRIPDPLVEPNGRVAYTINRCKIINVFENETEDDFVVVYCLDHGDQFEVAKTDLYQASREDLVQLPFQVIDCNLADLAQDKLQEKTFKEKICNLIYDNTRDKRDQLVKCKAQLRAPGSGDNPKSNYIYLYIPRGNDFTPLISVLENEHDLKIFNNDDARLREPMTFEDDSRVSAGVMEQTAVLKAVTDILTDVVQEELSAAGVIDVESM